MEISNNQKPPFNIKKTISIDLDSKKKEITETEIDPSFDWNEFLKRVGDGRFLENFFKKIETL